MAGFSQRVIRVLLTTVCPLTDAARVRLGSKGDAASQADDQAGWRGPQGSIKRTRALSGQNKGRGSIWCGKSPDNIAVRTSVPDRTSRHRGRSHPPSRRRAKVLVLGNLRGGYLRRRFSTRGSSTPAFASICLAYARLMTASSLSRSIDTGPLPPNRVAIGTTLDSSRATSPAQFPERRPTTVVVLARRGRRGLCSPFSIARTSLLSNPTWSQSCRAHPCALRRCLPGHG